MTIKTSGDGAAAVDHEYFWLPIDTAPHNVKVQLLSKHGVAAYGQVSNFVLANNFWTHWAPLPKLRRGQRHD